MKALRYIGTKLRMHQQDLVIIIYAAKLKLKQWQTKGEPKLRANDLSLTGVPARIGSRRQLESLSQWGSREEEEESTILSMPK